MTTTTHDWTVTAPPSLTNNTFTTGSQYQATVAGNQAGTCYRMDRSKWGVHGPGTHL